MEKPYVISAELDMSTANQGQLQHSQLTRFRESLDTDLRNCGMNTCWVDSATLRSGLQRAINQTSLPIISLDNRYVRDADQFIGISRAVDANLNDAGYTARAGCAPLAAQFEAAKRLGSEVALVDDVLFSGNMLGRVAKELAMHGVRVKTVIAGIAIGDGMAPLAQDGIDIQAVKIFANGVYEEVCERDFGFNPGSGRPVPTQNASALYFDPHFGRPTEWASLPEAYIKDFFVNNIERNINLLTSEADMSDIGAFVGYNRSGNARDVLRTRLKEVL